MIHAWLATHSLDTVEREYHRGGVGQVDYEAYRLVWERSGVPREPSNCMFWHREPEADVLEAAKRIVEHLPPAVQAKMHLDRREP